MNEDCLWNAKMHKRGLVGELFWKIDKRLFRWDHLPSLARLGFVQKSYLLLFVIPFLDQFLSPVIDLKPGTQIAFDFGWLVLLPEDSEMIITFELGMPFSWSLLYFLVLFLGMGSAIYEIYAPRIIGVANEKKVTYQLILQNFREVANGIFSAARANHAIYGFACHYIANLEELDKLTEEHRKEAEAQGEELIPLQEYGSTTRINKFSIYHHAEHMVIDPEDLDDAFEHLMWYLNEVRLIQRWICGSLMLASVIIFIVLVIQGFLRMVF